MGVTVVAVVNAVAYRCEDELAAQATRVTCAVGQVHHVHLVMGVTAGNGQF